MAEVEKKEKQFVEDMGKRYYELIETVHDWVKENNNVVVSSIVFDVACNKILDPSNKIDPEGYKRVIKIFYTEK